MATSLNRLRGDGESPNVVTYKTLRAAGKSWYSKITQHPVTKRFDVAKAAMKLTLPVEGRTIIFDDETEQAVLTDYYLFDYRPDGKSVAESCVFQPGELTPLETEIQQANLASRTSVFEVVTRHDTEPNILLRDRLNKEAPELWLTDLGLSESFRRLGPMLMFMRVASLQGVNMSGGFSFAFDRKYQFALIDEYRRAMFSVPTALHDRRRTAYYLGLKRRFGMAGAYAESDPSSESQV